MLQLLSIRALARTPRYHFKKTRRYYSRMHSKPLYFNDGPLVWIDCEMTGLDFGKDKIIEIAVRVLVKQMIMHFMFR